MKSNGKVIAINGNRIKLKMFKESSCAHCSGCGDANKLARELEVTYDGDVEIGDIVTFELEDSKMLKIGFTVYILPIIMMILGFFISNKMGGSEKISVLVSFAFLVLSFAGLHIYDKYFVKEKVEMTVTAVEKGSEIFSADSCAGQNKD
ncbi:SoxR reducing system RseC family protein [Fusobacterium perfoetens]|uniref:SoxR reducing system RseC family protein n=1 Tax=Fusobacterium perfoetens TaxID=852 RepID=UPI0015A1F23F|nr:SoxR reducing system RseC family protein [Fusobacterium perfoetens]MCF2624669.1 SoxR reducing system RseC family protein [Fusobacterium perfoetens]